MISITFAAIVALTGLAIDIIGAKMFKRDGIDHNNLHKNGLYLLVSFSPMMFYVAALAILFKVYS